MAQLKNYQTGEYIREATEAEAEASREAAETDGGSGVITVDGVSCYVEGSVISEDTRARILHGDSRSGSWARQSRD